MTDILLLSVLVALIFVIKRLGILVYLETRNAANIESMLDFVTKKTAETIVQEIRDQGYTILKKGDK